MGGTYEDLEVWRAAMELVTRVADNFRKRKCTGSRANSGALPSQFRVTSRKAKAVVPTENSYSSCAMLEDRYLKSKRNWRSESDWGIAPKKSAIP